MRFISAAPLPFTLGVVCTPAAADRVAASPAAPPAPTATDAGLPPAAAATPPLPNDPPDCPPAAAPSRTAVLRTASDMTVAVELSMTEEEEGELAGEGSGYW